MWEMTQRPWSSSLADSNRGRVGRSVLAFRCFSEISCWLSPPARELEGAMLAEAGVKENRTSSPAQEVVKLLYLLNAQSLWRFKRQLSKSVAEIKAVECKGPACGSGNP